MKRPRFCPCTSSSTLPAHNGTSSVFSGIVHHALSIYPPTKQLKFLGVVCQSPTLAKLGPIFSTILRVQNTWGTGLDRASSPENALSMFSKQVHYPPPPPPVEVDVPSILVSLNHHDPCPIQLIIEQGIM